MAATVSAWAKPGAWALDAEENENELLQQRKADDNNRSTAVETADFPSLSAAAATKTKKKKPQPISLQEFTKYGSAKPAEPKGLTPEELLILPTGPRQRTAEELDRNKLGGGFGSYGRGSRDEQQPRRFNRESSNNGNREFTPSRADETDDWASSKKTPSGFGGSDRRERGGFFTDSASRADDVDNWAAKKSFVPSEPRRYEKRGGGFGLDSSNGGGGGADSDNWLKRKGEEGRKIGFDSLRERRGGFESNGGGADCDTWGKKREDFTNNGSGGSRPKLNLQPRTLPVGEGDSKIEVAKSGNKGHNPFGEARPREEVLKEKGQDWKEIEQKLESSKIKENVGGADVVGKREKRFWSGRERGNVEAKAERAWRKPMGDSRPQSATESENGHAESAENGHAENGHTESAENGHVPEVEEKDIDAQM